MVEPHRLQNASHILGYKYIYTILYLCAKCILCHTKQTDWTCTENVLNGFPITHTAEEAMQIFTELSNEDGIVQRSPGALKFKKDALQNQSQPLINTVSV